MEDHGKKLLNDEEVKQVTGGELKPNFDVNGEVSEYEYEKREKDPNGDLDWTGNPVIGPVSGK